jgi:ferric-dicitrate binding protein FerR (iron transport regulator)
MTKRVQYGVLVALLSLVWTSAALAQNGAAKVLAMTGRVSVLRDSGAWALAVSDQVQPKQVIIAGPDGFARFQVSDGSTFDVFPNSKTIFRDNPGNWKDLLDVVIGRVKVHIEKLNGQPNNSKVHTPTAIISVRGTTFDVDVEDEDATTLVMVEEGQVAVEHQLLYTGPKLLNPGEWVRVYKNQPLAARKLDKGNVLRGVLRAAAQAWYDMIYRRPGGGAGGGSPAPAGTGGGTAQGDKDKGAPPTAPPPPPPPPGP